MTSHTPPVHQSVRWVSWDEFAQMSGRLAEVLAAEGISAVVGVARGGLIPATAVACALRCELYPARVTRRDGHRLVYQKPVWKVPIADGVKDHIVAVIDDVAATGETLALVGSEVLCRGASRVLTAALVYHPWVEPRPNVSIVKSDEFIVFPWTQRVYADGRWQAHPEVLAALARHGGSGS